MRSSNYRHSNRNYRNSDFRNRGVNSSARSRRNTRPAKKTKKVSKLGSLVVTAFVVVAAVIIPGVTLIQNVEAVTNVKNNVLSIGGSKVFSEVIAKSDKTDEEIKIKETQAPTEKQTETVKATEAKPEPQTEPKVTKTKALLASAKVDSSYSPEHVSLSSYDRAKLERLVMGEAGGLGYNGAALVAQTLRDTMAMENINSVDTIIEDYQYEGSTEGEASSTVKKAVSYIFDKDGYAVQHRLLYFYASDMIYSGWHESQEYIASCGAEKFFDKWN